MNKNEIRLTIKDEMKNRISLALKDPILQQGFEIICKESAELKAQLESDRDLPTIAYMQGAEKQKKKDEGQLTKAKELLKQWLQTSNASGCNNINIVTDTEQFLNSEVEK